MAKKKKTTKTDPPPGQFQTADKLDIQDPQPGLYMGVPFVDYLLIDAFSASQAKEILKSPSHLAEFQRRGPDTDALRMGSLFDTMLFDGGSIKQHFAKTPLTYINDKGEDKLWAKRGNSGAARKIKEKLEEDGQLLVKRDDWEAAEEMVAAATGYPPIQRVLSKGTAQVTMIWIDSETGVLCKGRVDWWRDDFLADLKSILAGGAQQLRWPREAKKYSYHVQAGCYVSGRAHLCGGEIVPFKFIVVEKKAPYPRMVYRTGEQTMKKGESDWRAALRLYVDCRDRNDWSRGYSEAEEVFEYISYDLVEHMTANDDLEGSDDSGI